MKRHPWKEHIVLRAIQNSNLFILTLVAGTLMSFLSLQNAGATGKEPPQDGKDVVSKFNYDDPPFYTMGPGELEMISDAQRKSYFKKFIKGFKDLNVEAPPGLVLNKDQLEDSVSHPEDWEKFMFVIYEKCTGSNLLVLERKTCKELEEARYQSLVKHSSGAADHSGAKHNSKKADTNSH